MYIPVDFHINYLNPNLNPKINPYLSSNSIYAASNIFYFKIILYFFPPVTTEDWNFTRKSGEDVLGYIVTTGPRFYQLCPVSLREDWFTAFQQSSFKCLT